MMPELEDVGPQTLTPARDQRRLGFGLGVTGEQDPTPAELDRQDDRTVVDPAVGRGILHGGEDPHRDVTEHANIPRADHPWSTG